jgi:hypothetical protein
MNASQGVTLADLEDLKAAVEGSGGVQTFPMDVVRDAYGAGRLGIHVRTNITRALQGMGLGHYPPVLPDSQYERVRIYKLGTPVSDLISAVLTPGEDGDERIRELSTGTANETLERVRELVCG